MSIFNESYGKWTDILVYLGIDTRYLSGKHTPCPICGGKDRFRYTNRSGNGEYICSQCGAGNGYTLLRKKFEWDNKELNAQIRNVIDKCRYKTQPEIDNSKIQEYIDRIWKESAEVTENDPVWLYLQRRCGPLAIPKSIRYHSDLYEKTSKKLYPTMVANMGNKGLLRTYLTLDGQKANISEPKKMLGEVGPILLSDSIGQTHLVAEGIETALAASKIYHVDTVWCTCNARQLTKFEWPEKCELLFICGDNDLTYTGQAVSYLLAHKLYIAGYPSSSGRTLLPTSPAGL